MENLTVQQIIEYSKALSAKIEAHYYQWNKNNNTD